MVYHVMRDGSVKTDITGHIVRIKDAEPVYRLLDSINEKRVKKSKQNRRQ